MSETEFELTPEHYNDCQVCGDCLAFDIGRSIESNDPDINGCWCFQYRRTERNELELPHAFDLHRKIYNTRWTWALEMDEDWITIRGTPVN